MKKMFIALGVLILVAVLDRGYSVYRQMNVDEQQKATIRTNVAEDTQNINSPKISPVQTTQATSTNQQRIVGSGEMKIYVVDSDTFDSAFTDPFQIDLFSNSILISSVDSQNGSMVSFKNLPFGVYTAHVKASGFKESTETFTFKQGNDKYSYDVTTIGLSR